jgi:uncharacterized protein HemX
VTATEQLHDDLPLGDQTSTQGAETVSELKSQPNNISALILANLALIVTVIFGAGITYARVGSVEVRVSALEARESQLDALTSVQSEMRTLKEEVMRLRDRLDRGLDATSERRLK